MEDQENSESGEDYHSEYRAGYPEYNALIDMYDSLCKALPIRDLFPKLITRRVIDPLEKAELCVECRSDKKITEKFISEYLFPPLMVGDTERFNSFMAVMEWSRKCDFLVKMMKKRIRHHRKGSLGYLCSV